jgi:hypothetical protein
LCVWVYDDFIISSIYPKKVNVQIFLLFFVKNIQKKLFDI